MMATDWVTFSSRGAGLTGLGAVKSSALAMFQPDAIDSGNAKTLEAFVIVAAISLLIVAIAAVVAAIGAYKAQQELLRHVNEIKGKLMPLIDKSHTLVTDLTPEIKQITTKVHEITGKVNEITAKVNDITAVVKEKVVEVAPTVSMANANVQEALGKARTTFADANQTVGDVNAKTRQQVERVNGMVSGALDATVRLGKAIEHSIMAPGRELAGIVAGAKATVDSLMKSTGQTVDTVFKGPNSMGAQIAGKLASLFAKKTQAASNASTRPAQPVRPSGAAATGSAVKPAGARVVPFGSMANAAGSGATGEMEPGISSGSTGNGDPIVG